MQLNYRVSAIAEYGEEEEQDLIKVLLLHSGEWASLAN